MSAQKNQSTTGTTAGPGLHQESGETQDASTIHHALRPFYQLMQLTTGRAVAMRRRLPFINTAPLKIRQ